MYYTHAPLPNRSLFGRWIGKSWLPMAALGFSLSAQDLPYDSGSSGADGALDIPFHIDFREDFGIAYDAARGEAVLFGGTRSNNFFAETWTLDTSTGVWTEEAPATFVSGREHFQIVYDPISESSILFGGLRADAVRLNDMWSWDGTDWSEITPATTSPTPRYAYSMAINPSNGNILLFGGYDAANALLSDTWLWDGSDWELVASATNPSASFPIYHRMVFHETMDAWILYNEWTRNTWAYDGTGWSELTTGSSPDLGLGLGMVYDAGNDEIVAFGGNQNRGETWVFNGTDWFTKEPTTTPNRRDGHGMFYNSDDGKIYATLGDTDIYYLFSANVWSSSATRFSTFAWDGTDWEYVSGWFYSFDMNEPDANGDGVWEFTTITVPERIQVRFVKDAGNSIVEWKASGDVLVDGYILVEGRDALENSGAGIFAEGGPGGGAGGVGGILFPVSGTYAGTAGNGPGGGAPGVSFDEDGGAGRFFGQYGNAIQQPVLAGSGGGGGASSDTANGGNAGAGGGAIVIEASGDITINGLINADGGRAEFTGNTSGGTGSGGGIVLRADRVLGSGTLWARGGRSSADSRAGRIRIEGFFRPLATNASPQPSATAPVEPLDLGAEPMLSIISIDGVIAIQPPSGSQLTPDVVFADNQPVTVVVEGVNIPEGTEVSLRITGTGTIIELPAVGEPAVTLDGSGQAVFTATVPAGVGTVQAFASFTLED